MNLFQKPPVGMCGVGYPLSATAIGCVAWSQIPMSSAATAPGLVTSSDATVNASGLCWLECSFRNARRSASQSLQVCGCSSMSNKICGRMPVCVCFWSSAFAVIVGLNQETSFHDLGLPVLNREQLLRMRFHPQLHPTRKITKGPHSST